MITGNRAIGTLCLLLTLCGASGWVTAQQDGEDIAFGKHRILTSKILGQDRMLYVNLPADYADSGESYPVVFQLYGHFKENYYLPAVRTTTLMHQHGEAPGIIVVGVMNREFRYRDLLPVDHNQTKSGIDDFLRFFEEELIPFVKESYRTNGYRILAGPQAGAAFGIYSLAKRPDLFDAYFLTSPFWIGSTREPLLEALREGLERDEHTNTFLMISYRGPLEESEKEALDRLSELIEAEGSFQYVLNPLEPDVDFTAPVDFHQGMDTLFRDYKFPGTDTPQELEVIEKYYADLSGRYGYPIKIPEHGLVFEGDKFVSAGSLGKATEIFLKMEELYPESVMVFDRLGTVAFRRGELGEARGYYDKFLEAEPGNPYALAMVARIQAAAPAQGVSGPYLGQEPPDMTPVVFAPGIVSSEESVDFSSAFSPDGTEFYFSRRKPDGPNQLLVSKLQDDNTWTAPEVVTFVKNYDASEASISPDGKYIFFGSRKFQSSSSTVWYSERTDSGWGEPTQLHEEMMYATLSRNRHLYYTDKSGGNIGTGSLISATFDAGELSDLEEVSIATENGTGNAHPYIAPDESYLIYDRMGDLHITFREDDGTWSSSRKLTNEINTPAYEFAPCVTPDGEYFFFTRDDNVYWVSAEVLHP